MCIRVNRSRIRGLVTIGLVIVTVIDFFLVGIKIYCAYSIVKNIYDIIRKKKEIIASDIGADVDEELEEGVDRRPLPTEDEIELIKARSDFNKFEARSKKTVKIIMYEMSCMLMRLEMCVGTCETNPNW